MRTILLAGACSMALSGCIPAAAGLALSAASLFTGGGGSGGDGFRNPVDRQTTGRQVRQALSQLNDQVDPACQAILDEYRQTHGTLTPGKAAQSADTAPEVAPGAAKAKAADEKAAKAEPPINLLAKIEPATEPETSDTSIAAAPEAREPVPTDNTTTTTVPAATKASLGSESTPAPGQCEHRFVCLPGTPKPTLMLMCPGKGSSKPEDGKTMASAVPEAPPAGDETAAPAPEQATAALEAETGASSDPGAADAAATPTATPPAVDTARASDRAAPAASDPAPAEKPAPRTIEGGGVADWNWSFDPAKLR